MKKLLIFASGLIFGAAGMTIFSASLFSSLTEKAGNPDILIQRADNPECAFIAPLDQLHDMLIATEMTNCKLQTVVENALSEAEQVLGPEAFLQRKLEAAASSIYPPVVVDEMTTLVQLDVDGTVVTGVYEIDPPIDSISAEWRSSIVSENCLQFEPMIAAGATFRHAYITSGGEQIGIVELSQENCRR